MAKNGILLFFIALVIFLIFLPSYTRMQDITQKNRDLEARIKELEVQQALLMEEKKRLVEDPVYLESVAREKMGLVKEGEVILKLTPQEAK